MRSHAILPTLRITLLALALCLAATAAAEIRIDLSSRFLARGEQALLEITTIGNAPDREVALPRIPGVEIRAAGIGMRPHTLPGRIRAYTAQFTIQSYEVGIHAIPSFDVIIDGERFTTRPVAFEIFNPDDLQWNEVASGGRPMRYATTIRTLKTTAYEGETLPVEIKVYVPQNLRVEDWGIPEFEVDGIASWRFEPSRMRSQVNLLGQPYLAMAYPSTMAATRTGQVRVGPASVRPTTIQVIMDRIPRQIYEAIELKIPAREIEAVPLPQAAPAGFDNAIGDFELRVSTAESEVREGDPVAVDIEVKGTGNLDVIRPPRPLDDDGWRAYEATAVDRGSDRTQLSGTVVFRQFLRPQELKSAVPPYRLVFFNPATASYETLTSEAIPLTLLPGPAGAFESSAPPPAADTPVERMTDILAIIRPASLTMAPAAPLNGWWLHGGGALLAMVLVLRALWLRFGRLLRRDPARTAKRMAFRNLRKELPQDAPGFLRTVGGFIEQWVPDHAQQPDLVSILAERDSLCFQSQKSSTPYDEQRRDAILRTLKRVVHATLALALTFAATTRPAIAGPEPAAAEAAMEAYESARFSEAAKLWLNAAPYETLAADTLYNIGNASYRLGSPGHAALYYRRALLRDPSHAEARQNLRFIERKVGAITIQRPNYQYVLGRTPLPFWKHTVAVSAWALVLALLVFPATRPGSGWRVPAICALVIAPLVATCAGLAWRYYPNDAEFAAPEAQAVVITAETLLHTEASRTAPEVIEAPPGSLLELLHVRGEWAYVAFATGTRGWIPLETLEKIIPEGTPEPPALRKPRATGSSA